MNRMGCSYIVVMLLLTSMLRGQDQICPENINFSHNDLSSWSARTGLIDGASKNYPTFSAGTSSIPEYGLSSPGIQVLTSSVPDKFGGFPTIPVINGFAYEYALKLGSESASWDLRSGDPNPGGFSRTITYAVDVPPGPVTEPYTLTYAYALVLENGTHNSNEQPLFKATVRDPDGNIIECASPSYYLPTLNNADQTNGLSLGATLDSAAARAEGFVPSAVPYYSRAGSGGGGWIQNVWTKTWTEVMFSLSDYRGQTVSISFESSNCNPGAHFAYAYVALRNDCGGPKISGNEIACQNKEAVYSIPSLTNGRYNWQVPDGWEVVSGHNSNILTVIPGTEEGKIQVHIENECAVFRNAMDVDITPPTVAGLLAGNNLVCAGTNESLLKLTQYRGNILNWISSADGEEWMTVANTEPDLTVTNLENTLLYKAVVQNGPSCAVDTSNEITITVDPRSNGGMMFPSHMAYCAEQQVNNTTVLTGHFGQVQHWQYSHNNTDWNNLTNTHIFYTINGINRTTFYRAVVKSGICEPDTSSVSEVIYASTVFPSFSIAPKETAICDGASVALNATIINGTNYAWNNTETLDEVGNGLVQSPSFNLQVTAKPELSTKYVLTVLNEGCPNPLQDTFHVTVRDPIMVNAGNDTSMVTGQWLQLNALVNDATANNYTWTPATGLQSMDVLNPIINLDGMEGSSIMYVLRAETIEGCFGLDSIMVTMFATGAEIFVPSAFTPNDDGLNDVIKPTGAGIASLAYFRIYNRYGELVYSTNVIGQGWDGRVNGIRQGSDNFVYIVEGVDFSGKTITKRGIFTLIN